MISTTIDAVTELILAEESHLRRTARRLARCEADADDLVQDTLLRAFRARDRFQPGTSIRAWTTTILRRVFLTAVVRHKRRRLETDTDSGSPLAKTPGTAAPASSMQSPPLATLLEHVEDDVRRALRRVPDLYLTPFLLAVIDELSCSEIAQRLGVPEGTVMSRIHRARERLKRDLVYSAPDRRVARAQFTLLHGMPRVSTVAG